MKFELQFDPNVAALQMLCFYGLNRSLLATTENLYLAAGKPEVRTKLNLLQLVLMALLMYPLAGDQVGCFGCGWWGGLCGVSLVEE